MVNQLMLVGIGALIGWLSVKMGGTFNGVATISLAVAGLAYGVLSEEVSVLPQLPGPIRLVALTALVVSLLLNVGKRVPGVQKAIAIIA